MVTYLLFFFFLLRGMHMQQLRDTAMVCCGHLCILIIQIMKKIIQG